MAGRSSDCRTTDVADKLKQALATLQEAYDYADDAECAPWDFAVPIRNLRSLGLNESDLRWLVAKGFVNHAREVTVHGDDGRQFRPTGNLTFMRRSCFVLTAAGAGKARAVFGSLETANLPDDPPALPATNGAETNGRLACVAEDPIIHWDPEARRLRINGQLVKRFKWPAMNQELILSAFQEEGWPVRIDDPLPCVPEQDPKRRLSDTIKCLNRKQACRLIRFCGDGTGEGVLWELIEPGANGHDGE